MKVKFWGVQGSTPNPLTNAQLHAKLTEILRRARGHDLETDDQVQAFLQSLPLPMTHTTGGNTTCFEISADNGSQLIVDLGSGARRLGLKMRGNETSARRTDIHVLMTHLHWDHIMGFPFFMPAYVEGNHIRFYGGHDYIEQALRRQTHPQSFPVSLDDIDAEISFQLLEEGKRYDIADFSVSCKRLIHPNDSFAYRITADGKSVVIATDAEYKDLDVAYLRPFIDFYRDADLLVFDAQYTLKDVFQKVDWGHSSSFIGVDISLMASVSKLVLTHHDPSYSDDKMLEILEKTEAFKQEAMKQFQGEQTAREFEVIMAYEDLEITL